MEMQLTFLGTGTSVGIPVIGCDCAVCLGTDPKDKRLRSSVYLHTPEAAWVVDTGPDFRTQCLRENIRHLDAALFTHSHMDHVTGFDELRRFTVDVDQHMPVHATPECLAVLERMFVYAFNGENRYRGYLKPLPQPVTGPFKIGKTTITPLPVLHGKVDTIGYLFERCGRKLCAYIPDCKTVPQETEEMMRGVDTLIIDALRHTPHPTHQNFAEALAVQREIQPRQTWYTHIQCEIMHAVEDAKLPPGVNIAHDGLKLEWS